MLVSRKEIHINFYRNLTSTVALSTKQYPEMGTNRDPKRILSTQPLLTLLKWTMKTAKTYTENILNFQIEFSTREDMTRIKRRPLRITYFDKI